jgi:hypothetical protein
MGKVVQYVIMNKHLHLPMTYSNQDILPLLLSPSPTLHIHALNALSNMYLQTPEPPSYAQLRALMYAVRWEAGIANMDFISSALEGERWLVWAAGNVCVSQFTNTSSSYWPFI